ncbi:MAG: gamma carbonic anhydrase family protein [Acidimicrobiia bacterium]|nr:gamma carbonic anhydrase family protein [Acidimicrobiia bacterium]
MPIYALGDSEPRIHPSAFVHPDAVVIGDVEIGARASVWPGAVLRGDGAGIVIGDETSVQDGSVLHTTATLATIVGARCVIGHIVHLEGCHILDGALVGNGAVVLHEAEVRSGALVGANAVVPNAMVVPERAMALGVPARIREGVEVDPAVIEASVEGYIARAARYRTDLRRLG